MTTPTLETYAVPAPLEAPVRDALEWLNRGETRRFELTGLVGETLALAVAKDAAFELGLVLCNGEICKCEHLHFEPGSDGFKITPAEKATPAVPALLDPPPGLRRSWLDEQLEKHEFLLLLFYRGRW